MSKLNIPPGLLDKLNKLKNLEEGAKAVGSMEESANAAAKFQALLLKHNLDEETVRAHEIKQKVEMLVHEFDVDLHQAKTEAGWVEKLIQGVAYFCMCKVVNLNRKRHPYDQGVVTILGEATNVATVIFMVEHLIAKINISAKVAHKMYNGPEKRNTFRRGFLIGCVNSIYMRLYKQEQEMLEQQRKEQMQEYASNTNMGLMVVSKREKAEEFMLETYPNIKRSTARQTKGLSGRDGYFHGRIAGENMDLDDKKQAKKLYTELTDEFSVRDALRGSISGNYERDLKILNSNGQTCSRRVYEEAYQNDQQP